MPKHDELLALFDLASRKGHEVTQSTMRDHVRLIGPDSELSEEQEQRAVSYAEARRYLVQAIRCEIWTSQNRSASHYRFHRRAFCRNGDDEILNRGDTVCLALREIDPETHFN